MPQLPESVVIVTKNNEPVRLEIDGTEFPWHLSSDEGTQIALGEKISFVTITLLVDTDRLTVRNES